MSFRAREMYKKVVRRVGGEGKLPAELMKSVKDMLPNSKVVMGRAKRGIFAGRHIQFGNKVTTHALRCIDKAGGIDEYLLKTPYKKMDTEMGIAWKAKIEKMYSELAEMEVGFFPPEEEAKIDQGFDEVRAAKRDFRREARRALAKQRQLEAGEDQTTEVTDKKEEVSTTAAAA
ncbi:hypothetical protein PVAP13_2NG523900 [Panicum virgatum]|uniref:Uncharacterized protein n=1 Tax=Panicum virgatum TaxID=38727 RepID=A0A8T0VL21_PANVG|nr:hypothetical protein PVAP13_2NG523900 [Panicum virgatum]